MNEDKADDKKIILQIKGLRLEAVRGGAVIVDNVDVTLHAGEVLGLIGESGAGKSTIGLAAISYARAGVHIADGSVEIDGVRGIVERIGATDTLLRNGDRRWSVPNGQLLERVVTR